MLAFHYLTQLQEDLDKYTKPTKCPLDVINYLY